MDQNNVHRTLRIINCNSIDKIIIINEDLVLKQILSCQRKAYSIPTSVILLMLLHASSLYVVERKINDKSFILHHQSQRYDKCFHLSVWLSCRLYLYFGIWSSFICKIYPVKSSLFKLYWLWFCKAIFKMIFEMRFQ